MTITTVKVVQVLQVKLTITSQQETNVWKKADKRSFPSPPEKTSKGLDYRTIFYLKLCSSYSELNKTWLSFCQKTVMQMMQEITPTQLDEIKRPSQLRTRLKRVVENRTWKKFRPLRDLFSVPIFNYSFQ